MTRPITRAEAGRLSGGGYALADRASRMRSARRAQEGMTDADARQFLLDIIESEEPDDFSRNPLESAGIRLTLFQERILRCLIAHPDEFVGKSALQHEMSWDQPVADWSETNTTRVHIYRIRQACAGQPFTIESRRDLGYRIVREPGAVMPWEVAS